MIDPGLAGRIALITGANQGIGAATARALAAQGVSVFLTYLRPHPAEHADDPAFPAEYRRARAGTADEVVDEIRAASGRAESTEADLSDPTRVVTSRVRRRAPPAQRPRPLGESAMWPRRMRRSATPAIGRCVCADAAGGGRTVAAAEARAPRAAAPS